MKGKTREELNNSNNNNKKLHTPRHLDFILPSERFSPVRFSCSRSIPTTKMTPSQYKQCSPHCLNIQFKYKRICRAFMNLD